MAAGMVNFFTTPKRVAGEGRGARGGNELPFRALRRFFYDVIIIIVKRVTGAGRRVRFRISHVPRFTDHVSVPRVPLFCHSLQ